MPDVYGFATARQPTQDFDRCRRVSEQLGPAKHHLVTNEASRIQSGDVRLVTWKSGEATFCNRIADHLAPH